MALLGMLVLAVVLSAWAGIAVAEWVRRRRGDGPRPTRTAPSPAKWAAWVAGFALLAGGVVHAHALLRYMPFLFAEDTCWFTVGRKVYPDSSDALPVSLVCDGMEAVPSWINPTLLGLAVTTVVATAVAVVLARRAWLARRAAG
ncbi:hypothetical protein ACFY7C_12595 [Streptomyces sp. NPDC012769]|uniref:hypothetical protein n=1 Tax=Streptomyces sp. NPDC012769 TaxID=3364848 RepID=UPI003678F3A3